MKETFKQLILDFQNQRIPLPTHREIPPLDLPKGMRKAFVLIGMRRSGKTWTLYQQMHHLLDQGLERKKLIYLNFEDDRLMGTTAKDLQSILDAYFELFPDLIGSTVPHFFFDEIHEVPGWERFIRRLLDQESKHIYLTGSSAKMLSKEIATALRGRTLVREVFPYNFSEYLTHLRIPHGDLLSTKQRALLNHHAYEYLKWGGFPESVGIAEGLHREILQGYIDTVVYRDIIERYGISNVHVLRALLNHCLQNPATLFSVNKMYQALKSQGFMISKNSLYTFMDHFEDAYCIFSLSIFDFSSRKATLKPKKIYPIDPGLITAYSLAREYQQGSALESLVFTTLLRQAKSLHYFLSKKGREVDFLMTYPNLKRKIIQVSLSLKNPSTRKRELTALEEAMEELDLKEGYVVTLEEKERLRTKKGTIHVIPLLQFLLSRAE